ncbi:MAG: hypothetical protein WBP08_08975 [Saprospiraceae bacterium]|nr:hypothetical protein [Saprospiraceae bacterium]
MGEDTYNEIQRIDSLWPLLIFTLAAAGNWLIYFYFGYSDFNLFYVSMLSALLLSVFLFSLRLYTRIDISGVQYRFFPFHFAWRKLAWREITSYHIREYNPWAEFGGWGLRYGKSGWACTISGKAGLQLVLVSKKKVLIGTVQPDKMKDFINLRLTKTI